MKRVVVVPCFNEELRLDGPAILPLVDDDTSVLFVDDGSTDGTLRVLEGLRALEPRVSVLALANNSGKAEAVRQGLLRAIADGALVVGYLDADLSTPVSEMQRLLRVVDDRADIDVVLGSRVALLGREVERSPARHYLGRVFATVASATLGLRVYDTQCGAKVFRAGGALRSALVNPFTSRWAFDVELLSRLLEHLPQESFFELPLNRWRDVAGSKLTAAAMVKAGADVLALALRRRRR